jgi:release factor glutamine methyltransferase
MKIYEARDYFIQALETITDKREASNIFKMIHEELFNRATALGPGEWQQLNDIIQRLKNHEPIQYILGAADFYGLKFKVNPNVLIPRPETEELVWHVIKEIQKTHPNIAVLDIGTGSGCIAIAIKRHISDVAITAIDVSSQALDVAKENAYVHGAEINFIQMDFLNENSRQALGTFDFIVSNPPYVTPDEMQQLDIRVRNYEPHEALTVGHEDALLFYRYISAFAKTHLNRKGKIFVELNAALACETAQIFSDGGYKVQLMKDFQHKWRILKAEAN